MENRFWETYTEQRCGVCDGTYGVGSSLCGLVVAGMGVVAEMLGVVDMREVHVGWDGTERQGGEVQWVGLEADVA